MLYNSSFIQNMSWPSDLILNTGRVPSLLINFLTFLAINLLPLSERKTSFWGNGQFRKVDIK